MVPPLVGTHWADPQQAPPPPGRHPLPPPADTQTPRQAPPGLAPPGQTHTPLGRHPPGRHPSPQQAPPGRHPPPPPIMVNQLAVRILLECILVLIQFSFDDFWGFILQNLVIFFLQILTRMGNLLNCTRAVHTCICALVLWATQ